MNARLPVTLLSDLYPRDGLSNLPFPLSIFLYYNYKLQDTDNTSRSNMVLNNRVPTSRYTIRLHTIRRFLLFGLFGA